jgi:hypothetical protein
MSVQPSTLKLNSYLLSLEGRRFLQLYFWQSLVMLGGFSYLEAIFYILPTAKR